MCRARAVHAVRAAAVRQGKHGKVPITMAGAREESETALNVCIQKVLDRTGLKPHQVGPAHARIFGMRSITWSHVQGGLHEGACCAWH